MKATLRNRNLFIRAHEAQHGSNFDRIGSGWENTLTDQLAFLLSADNETRTSFTREILGTGAEPVAKITTQARYEQGCPDLEVELESGRLLLLEHKVDASLGTEQLERYLTIKDRNGRPASVALISRKHTQIATDVLGNPRYLRPQDKAHWFWQDVYHWIPDSDSAFGTSWVRRCFREYLELLGFSPSDLQGNWERLLDPDVDANPIRDEFGRRLSLIRTFLLERGYKVTGDWRSGLNTSHPGKETPYRHITVGPARARRDQMATENANKVRTAVLRVTLVYDSAESPPDANDRYAKLSPVMLDGNGFEWYPVAPHRMTNNRTRLSVISNLSQFLEDDSSISERLSIGFQAAYAALCT